MTLRRLIGADPVRTNSKEKAIQMFSSSPPPLPTPWLTATLGMSSYFGHHAIQMELLTEGFADHLPHRSPVSSAIELLWGDLETDGAM